MSASQHVSSNVGRSPRLALQLGALVLLGYWAVTIYRLGGLWSALPEYSYGWVVPMLCVMLFAERWRTRPDGIVGQGSQSGEVKSNTSRIRKYGKTETLKPRPSRFAIGVLILAACLFALARAALEVIPSWRFSAWTIALSAAVLSWWLLWSIGGMVWVRHFFFPVAFFLLAVPWPDRFEGPFIQTLTEFNAALTVEVLAFLKVAAVRMGNIILIEPGMVGVQEACSGIRSFQSTLMVSLFLGELFRFSFWRRVAFVWAGAMLAFGFNIIRTSFLVWTCNRDGLGAVDKFHDPAGWSILGASMAGLILIGWWLNRSQKRQSGKQTVEIQGEVQNRNLEIRNTETPQHRTTASSPSVIQPAPRLPISALCFLLVALVSAELGIRWWFLIHSKVQHQMVEWVVDFENGGAAPRPLKITREVQAMLSYDLGTGWEWQGGGAERWQAFYFVWDKPRTIAREINCAEAATGHQPELCFTKAGMQLRQMYGLKRYIANGVPLVFKVYEFADRNIPIFVFACTWERNAEQTTTEEDRIKGDASTVRGIRQAVRQFSRGERSISDEVRVFKLGVWGPRTIGEAEASFQQQLNLLVQPVSEKN